MLPIIISIISAIIASASLIYTRKTIRDQRYLGLLNEYKSVDMLSAFQGLYAFKEKCEKEGKNIKDEYESIKVDDDIAIEYIDDEKKLDFIKNTLHCQRRVVSYFYHYMYSLIDLKLVSKKQVFTFWTKCNLKIIPDIIEKIERDTDKHLMELYKKAETF